MRQREGSQQTQSSIRSLQVSPSSQTTGSPLLSRNNSFSQHTDAFHAILQRSLSFEPLLKRGSTFWPSREEIIARHPSLESLNPEYDSELRKTSPLSAIFNLVATVCGGGVLTLPIAFARAGVIPSTILMIISAIVTDFAMYILCSCARRTGTRSYGDVTRVAFGLSAEIGVTVLLFVFLLFVIIAYFVLVKDIWTPVLMHICPSLRSWCIEKLNADPDVSSLPSFIFLVGFIILSLPLLLKRDLHALRHTCYVGFASLILLMVAIVRRSYQRNCVTDIGIFAKEIKWTTYDMNDIIYAFPIIALSFFSIYNVLSVHSALIRPTRERVKFVLDGTIVICFTLFYAVGLFGYLNYYDGTLDNILLNFPLEYNDVLVGRIGYGFTLMFGLPLVFLPCREALLTIPVLVHKWWDGPQGDGDELPSCPPERQSPKAPGTRKSGITKDGHIIVNGVDFDAERPLLMRNLHVMPVEKTNSSGGVAPMQRYLLPPMSTQTSPRVEGYSYGSISSRGDITPPDAASYVSQSSSCMTNGNGESVEMMPNEKVLSPSQEQRKVPFSCCTSPLSGTSRVQKDAKESADNVSPAKNVKQTADVDIEVEVPVALHVLSTLSILSVAYFCAVAVPGVGLVWSICGSSMSLLIGFFVPAACYLKIRSRKTLNPRTVASWMLLIFSVVASYVCTCHIITDAKVDQAK